MPRYVSGCAVRNACRVHLRDTGEKELELARGKTSKKWITRDGNCDLMIQPWVVFFSFQENLQSQSLKFECLISYSLTKAFEK